MIGATTSQSLDLTLLNKGDMVYGTSTIKVEIGLKIGSKIEYIPMGIYNIDDIEKTDYTVKITAFDNMIKFESPYFSSLGDKPTLQQVVNELAAKTGVQFTGTVPAYTVKKLEGFSCREVLGYVASICGGNAVITRDGKFTIVTPKDINYPIGTSNYFDYKREESKYKIGEISCQVGEKVLSKGSLGANSMELEFENPWVTDSILQNIYNKLNGFEYLGYSMKWQGDLSLDVGDIVTITDKKGVVRKHPILSQKFTYTGGLTSEIEAKGENKNKNSFSSSGGAAKKVDRIVTELAIINKALIDVAYIGDLTAGNIKFDTASGNIMDLQTLLTKFVTGENGQFLNLTTDNVTISSAVIKDIIAKNISVEDLKAGRLSTNKINISSDDGGITIVGPTMQFKDKSNKVRIQMGQDTQGDFNFILRGEDGTTILIDHNGIKEKAIADNLIKENMVAEGAIGEKQINYSSLVTGFNKDTNTSLIQASKVAIDLTGQSLEVAFNNLKSNVDGINSTVESNTTAISIAQGKIEGLIKESSITKGDITTLKDNYTSIKATVDGINTTVASHTSSIGNLTSNLNGVSGKITTVENKQSTLEQNLNGFKTTVSSTYATKTALSTANSSISSLQTRMSSAESKITDSAIINTVQSTINKAKSDAIAGANSSTDNKLKSYATKSEVTQTTNNITFKFSSSGGYNIVKNGGFKNGLSGWHEAAYYPNGTGRSIIIFNDSDDWVLDGTYALCIRSTNNTSGEFRADSQKFKVKRNTTYTLSYLVAAHRLTEMGHFIRGNEWELIDSMRYCPGMGGKNRKNWTRITQTFNTGNNHQISLNFIHFITGNDAYSWVTDVMINEGEIALPWSPHPDEIYNGNTVIDGSGVTINNGALRVKNKAGQTTIEADSAGNLKMNIYGSKFRIAGTGGRGTNMWTDYYDKFILEVPYYQEGSGIWIKRDTGATIMVDTARKENPFYKIWIAEMVSPAIKANQLYVTGSKNCLQTTKNYGERLINAYETAEYYFGDIGSGIIKNGECIVMLDDILQECINTDIEYHVFTQVYTGNIEKIERYKTYFIVYGKDDTEFSWELKAKRKGYENVRLDTVDNIQHEKIDDPHILLDKESEGNNSLNIEELLLEETEGRI